MIRNARIAAVLLLAGAVLGSASIGRAAVTDNSTCHSLKLNGQKIQWEVIGSWTCAKAKPWLVKMDADHVSAQLGRVPLHNGPAGYHCFATRETASGKVIDGVCYLGTLAFPKSGFTW